MAWQAPAFVYRHAIADAIDDGGIAAVVTVGTEDTDNPLQNLADYRIGSYFGWTDTSSSHTITIDRTDTVAGAVNYIWFSGGTNCNLNGATFTLDANATDSWGAPTNLVTSTAILADTTTNWGKSFTESTLRWLKISFTSSGAWTIPQIVIGKNTSLASQVLGSGPAPTWDTEPVVNGFTIEKPWGGSFFEETGTRRDAWHFTYHGVGLDTAGDATHFTNWMDATKGWAAPFLFREPFDATETGYKFYRMDGMPRKTFDRGSHISSTSVGPYRYEFDIREFIS